MSIAKAFVPTGRASGSHPAEKADHGVSEIGLKALKSLEALGGEEKGSSLQPLSFPVFPTQFGKFEFIRVPRLVDYFFC